MNLDDIPSTIAVDANTLVCICGKSSDAKDRLESLFAASDRRKGRIVIPTPAIAEFLVYADVAAREALRLLQRKSSVVVAPFDLAAAFEASLIDGAALGKGDKRDGISEPWQKVKIDRQIVAIAKSNGARAIISNDDGVRATAGRVGIEASSIEDLPYPDHLRQQKLLPKDA